MHNILGLNWGHDGSAAVIRDGKLVCAIARERLTREKKAAGVTREIVDYVLSAAGLTLADIHAVAFATYLPFPESAAQILTAQGAEIRQPLVDLTGGDCFKQCLVRFPERTIPGFFIHHHLAHCAAAYYTSNFEAAMCASVDASRRHAEACSVYAYGQGNKLFYFYCPGIMVGNMYDAFTDKLGLGPGLMKAGTLMGLAPYGTALPEARSKLREFGAVLTERKFIGSDTLYIDFVWSQLSGLAPHQGFAREKSDSKEAMNLAASMQYIFEESILREISKLRNEGAGFHSGNLCLGGGSFLNSETNMRISAESGFSKLHLFPACGDDGTAVGSALYVGHHIGNLPRVKYEAHECMYLGREYREAPSEGSFPYDPEKVAALIAEGKIVAWVQGKSEFGPRALGNRSFLCDPRKAELRDTMNAQVKCREWFRPFAPAVRAPVASEWFDIPFESPFMLFIAKVKQPDKIPAVTHVDGSARLQTVSSKDNPRFYELLEAFEKVTAVPVLLNTSLNLNGEPLVETPTQAHQLFQGAPIDALVVNDRMWVKS